MKSSSRRVLGLLMVLSLLMVVGWRRAEDTIYQLRCAYIRAGSNGGTVTFLDPVVFDEAATFASTTSGPITFTNGPVLNADDSNTVSVTYAGSGVALAEYTMISGAASNLVADSDTMEIIMSAKSSLNVAVEYGTLGLLINDVTDGTEDSSWILRGQSAGSELDFLTIGSSAGTALVATFTPGMEVSVDGKYAAVGPDATTGLMMLTGSFTNGQAEVVFGTYFGGVPVVIANFTNDISSMVITNGAITASAVTTSNFVPKAAAAVGSIAVNANYIAIGARP